MKKIEDIKILSEENNITTKLNINCRIKPTILIQNNKRYEIINLKEEFIIKNYSIILKNGFLNTVYFDSPHPNKNPDNNEYCLGNYFKIERFEWDSDLDILEHQILIHNYDNCYQKYWGTFSYVSTDLKQLSFKINKEKQIINKGFNFSNSLIMN